MNIMNSGLDEIVVNKIVSQVSSGNGNKKKANILVNGTVYQVDVNSSDPKSSTSSYPNCPVDFCIQVQSYINKYCAEHKFPSGTPILLFDPNTEGVCNCYCI